MLIGGEEVAVKLLCPGMVVVVDCDNDDVIIIIIVFVVFAGG